MENYAGLLLDKGMKFRKVGKALSIAFISSFGVWFLGVVGYWISCICFDCLLEAVLGETGTITDAMVPLGNLGMIVGSPGPILYLCGLHFLGLGEIANRTKPIINDNYDLPKL